MKRISILALAVAVLAVPLRADWIDYPITDDTFSGNGSLQWTAAEVATNGSSMSYAVLNGDTCIISFALIDTDVKGFGTTLRIRLPPGIMSSRYVYGNAHIDGIGESSGEAAIVVSDDEPFIMIGPWHGVINHPASLVSVIGQITFPICYSSAPCSGSPKRRAVRR